MGGPLEIGQDILAAQGDIFKQCAKRYGIKVAFLCVALVFFAFAAIALHGVLWAVFLEFCHVGVLGAAACVLGVDVLLGVIFLLFACRASRPSLAEDRARIERDKKWQDFRQAFALSTVLNIVSGPVGRYAGGQAWRLARGVFSRRKK